MATLRQFGLTFNRKFEQWMFLLVPGSLILGFLLSHFFISYVSWIPYLFAYVTLYMGLGCGLTQIREVFRKPGLMVWTFIIAHLISPFIAYGLGSLVFGADSPYVVGFVLFTIIPLGVSSVLWVGMSGGNVPLILAMVVIDSALSPLIVPTGIHWMFNTTIHIDTTKMIIDLMSIIVVPTIVGVLLHHFTKGSIKATVDPLAAPLSKLCFVAVVFLNASAIAPQAALLKEDLFRLVPLAIVLVGICYALGFVGSLPFRNQATITSISYATGMRNISLGIVLALGFFGPLTAVPVVLAILIQQPIATLHQLILRKIYNRSTSEVIQ